MTIKRVVFKYCNNMESDLWSSGIHKECELYHMDGMDGMGITRYYESKLDNVRFSTLNIGGNVVLHNLTQPAYYNSNGVVTFFMYGFKVLIDDLHCDGETKCMLTLKYTRIDDTYMYR